MAIRGFLRCARLPSRHRSVHQEPPMRPKKGLWAWRLMHHCRHHFVEWPQAARSPWKGSLIAHADRSVRRCLRSYDLRVENRTAEITLIPSVAEYALPTFSSRPFGALTKGRLQRLARSPSVSAAARGVRFQVPESSETIWELTASFQRRKRGAAARSLKGAAGPASDAMPMNR